MVDGEFERLEGIVLALQQGISSLREEITRLRDEREVSREELRRYQEIATKDPLTEALNRRGLYEFLDREIGNITREIRAKSLHKPLSLAYMDLNRFKPVNDEYGHNAGDIFLVEFVKVLREGIRGNDGAARIGGDEFVLALPETIQSDAKLVVNRISEKAKKITLPEYRIEEITFSAGISSLHEGKINGTELTRNNIQDIRNTLIQQADVAMYYVKKNLDKIGIQIYSEIPSTNGL